MQDAVRGPLLAFIRSDLVRGQTGVDLEKDSLIDTGLIDSVGILKLVTFIDTQFGVHISDDDLVPENFDRVDAIVKLIGERKAARS